MAMKPQTWSISGLAVEFGLDRRTIARRLENVHPAESSGRSARYRMLEAAGAICGPAGGGRAAETAAAGPLDLTAERARLAKFQADKTELEVAVLRGDLIPGEIVKDVWGDYIAAARAKLIALPSTAAPRVAGGTVREVELELRDLVHQALTELKDYDPADYQPGRGRTADAGVSADDSTAAESDGERVGRRAPGSQPRKQRRTRPVENG
jgi:phage terminase Nu1 subunit (DNA packaging protein)